MFHGGEIPVPEVAKLARQDTVAVQSLEFLRVCLKSLDLETVHVMTQSKGLGDQIVQSRRKLFQVRRRQVFVKER